MSQNRIEILSPGKSCRRTQKIIRYLEYTVKKHHVDADVVVITEALSFLNYRTWILPTVVINGKILARGYRPSEKNILKYLK